MLVADAFSSFCLVDSDGPERDGSRSAKWAFRGRRYGAGRLGLATLVPWGLRAGGSWMRVKDIFDVAGYVTGCGNPVRTSEGRPAAKTAPAVQALLDASHMLNANLWWLATQIGLRFAVGVALWLTYLLGNF